MANHHEAGGSGSAAAAMAVEEGARNRNLNQDQAAVLYEHQLLVPPDHRLPHSWSISAAGYALPPIPKGEALRTYINIGLAAFVGFTFSSSPEKEKEPVDAAPPQGRLVLRPVKEEKREKACWELELQASFVNPNDPVDASGQGLLLQHSDNTPQPLGEVESCF